MCGERFCPIAEIFVMKEKVLGQAAKSTHFPSDSGCLRTIFISGFYSWEWRRAAFLEKEPPLASPSLYALEVKCFSDYFAPIGVSTKISTLQELEDVFRIGKVCDLYS